MQAQAHISERINHLFLLNIGDLETTLVSQVIRLNMTPQRLIEEIQTTVNDYKQKMFSSLIQLIQMVSHFGGQQNTDIKQVADALEQQVVKCKQTHLLFQMKAMVNCKIKALLETLTCSQASNKAEIQKQLALLQESLQKIETTLHPSGFTSPQTSHITPLPRRQLENQFSQDGLTPMLSEEAEKKARVQFITPGQYDHNQQPEHFNTQFQYTPLSNTLESSVLLNKTLNSFNNENGDNDSDLRKKTDHIQQLISNAFDSQKPQLPQFGGTITELESSEASVRHVHFENEFMSQAFIDQKFRTEQESDNECVKPNPPAAHRKTSAQSLSHHSQSPCHQLRNANSTNSKQQMQRSNKQKPCFESVNLFNKLNQAGNQRISAERSRDKENVPASNRITAKKVTPPVVKRPTQSLKKIVPIVSKKAK